MKPKVKFVVEEVLHRQWDIDYRRIGTFPTEEDAIFLARHQAVAAKWPRPTRVLRVSEEVIYESQ